MLIFPINTFAHWAEESVEYAITNEFIASDSFIITKLDTPILRGAVVELVSNAMPDNLEIADIVIGDEYGDLMLERTITREEFFTVIGRAFSLPSEDFAILNTFTDVNDISEFAKPFISGLVQENFVLGYPSGAIMPQGNITNAEAIAVVERVHRYISEIEELPEQPQPGTTNPPIISGSGGGFRPRPPTTSPTDIIPPTITLTLSDEDWTWEPVTITINVTSNVGIRNVRWIKALHGGNNASLAHIPYNVNYRLLILYHMLGGGGLQYVAPDMYLEVQTILEGLQSSGVDIDFGTIRNYFENAFREVGIEPDCGGWLEWARNSENFEDFSDSLIGNEILTKQNGIFYILAEDLQGNITIKEIFVSNIKTAQAELDITRYGTPVSDAIASVRIIEIEENPNAPVVEKWLIPGRLPMVGGGFRDTNWSIANFVETAQNAGTIIVEIDGEFLITELDIENASRWGGAFMFVMLDEWGNYSFSTVTI